MQSAIGREQPSLSLKDIAPLFAIPAPQTCWRYGLTALWDHSLASLGMVAKP